jgi:hypothetical protein
VVVAHLQQTQLVLLGQTDHQLEEPEAEQAQVVAVEGLVALAVLILGRQ